MKNIQREMEEPMADALDEFLTKIMGQDWLSWEF